MRRFSPALALLACACVAPAARSADSPIAAVRLVVSPERVELWGSGARYGVLVTAIDAAGASHDVTAASTFSFEGAAAAELGVPAELIAKADGESQLVVKYGNQTKHATVVVHDALKTTPPNFANDVIPIFTKTGCNQGSCHGKGVGQNGFRLSLRGYAPEMDYESITREYSGRRISLTSPAESALLRKPLLEAPHAGGRVLRHGSQAQTAILKWIEAGAPGPKPDDASVTELVALPGNRNMQVGETQQLLVEAKYSNGQVRDVTWLTRFDANDPGVIEVSPAGMAKALRAGETAVRVSFKDQVGVTVLTIPYGRTVPPAALAQRNNVIDEHVLAKLGALGIEPSPAASDEEFLRRAMLDTIGVLPTPGEVRAFVADAAPDKRAKLVDRLLERPEFVDYWTLQLADLLQNRKERDHDVRGVKGVRDFHAWLRTQVAANRPWNELARDVLTATGTTTQQPAVGYYIVTIGEEREAQKSDVVASVAQAFLGTRIGCAKCHNHPLEKYTQDDYYHFAAFFSRVKFDRQEAKKGATRLSVSHPDPNQNAQPIGVTQPRTGQFMKPQPLDRSPVAVAPGEDPRAKLVDWMTSPSNTYFSGSMVNRIWQHFLGTGLVEPVDDLRPSNPPSNPALFAALNQEFVEHKYDLKHLMRLVLNSRTYQLGSSTANGNATDTRFYSHYYARRLPAEVLLDAISTATGVAERFPGYPEGVRAMELPDPGTTSYFLGLFGRSDRVTACACERSGEVTLPQLLHLQNSENVLGKIAAGDGRLVKLLAGQSDNHAATEELFLATLSRRPTPEEQTAVDAALASGPRDEGYRDLFWALVNSKEFTFNH